jgi:hypothetical protein
MLSYETVQTATDEEFKALTSLTKAEFEELLKNFARVWEDSSPTPGTPRRGRPAKLVSSGDKLLFILFYLKNYPLQEVLGFWFGLDQSQANRWIKTLSVSLREALKRGGYLPAREAPQLEDDLANLPPSDLIVDGTERRRQRPKDQEAQRLFYSGKKTAHTFKNLVIVNEKTQHIDYLSPTVEGKKHDKKLAEESQLSLPPTATVIKDKGFEGYEVPGGACHYQPQKKPRGGELSPLQKTINSVISGVRIVVEHVIAGIKRCRIVKDIFRNTMEQFDDLVMEIACGLHNFRVTFRKLNEVSKIA